MRISLSLVALLAGLTVCLPPRAARAEPLRVTAQRAVELALQKNLDMAHARLAPDLSDAARRKADATFEPTISSSFDVAGSPGQISQQLAGLSPVSSIDLGGSLGVRKEFSTGTSLEARLSSTALFGGGGSRTGLDPAYQTGINLTARQSLLKGLSRSANEVAVTTARLTRGAARKNLARTAELIAWSTLKSYWDLHAALAKVQIQKVALKMAQRTHAQTVSLIGAGKLPASEEVAANYLVQTQRRDLLTLARQVSNTRDELARLMGLVPAGSTATPEIVTVVGSRPKRWAPSRKQLQRIALKRRGDYLYLLEQLKIHRAELDAARHRRLPTLDLVGGLTLTGLSGTATGENGDDYPSGYWSSFGMKRVGWSAGLVFELPLFNNKQKAEIELAELKHRRAKLSVDLAVQALSQELNVALRAVDVARQQLRLTKAAARVAETKLVNEQARYAAGKITAHILSTVQAEVVKERLAKEQALADLIKARVDLYAAAGVLISRMREIQRQRRQQRRAR